MKPSIVLVLALCLAAACASATAAAPPAGVPRAIYADRPTDPAHRPVSTGVRFVSHGQSFNGTVERPSGPGPFPVLVIMHGLPGYEGMLNLADPLRRAGWAVVHFHYRGFWGSEGMFSFDGAQDDADAVVARLRDPATANAWGIDPARIVVLGHSMGGLAAAHACAREPAVIGCVLLAPWDPSADAGPLATASPAERAAFADGFNDLPGRVAGITPEQLVELLATKGQTWRLADFAPAMANRPLLIVTAKADDDDDKALALRPALAAAHAARLRNAELDTNHGFEDHRLALATLLLRWLATLPGAPPLR